MNIDHILSSNDLNSVEANLRTLISSFKLTGNSENKKTLIEFFKGIFSHLKVKVTLTKFLDFLNLMWNNIHDLAGLFPDILNTEIKSHLNELTQFLKCESDVEIDNSLLQNILKCSLIIVCLTNGLGSTNQMLSNYMILVNMFVNRPIIAEENSLLNTLLKLHFTSILVKLCENTKSYNPQLINSLEKLISYCLEQISEETYSEDQNSDMSLLNLIELSLYDNSCAKESPNITLSLVIPKILDNLSILMKTFDDDINFSLIFRRSTNILITLNTKLNEKFAKEGNNSLFSTIITKSNQVINSYNYLSASNNQKKNVEINFMRIKKKSIPSLEPDIERAFLGGSYLPISEDPIKAKAIERKIKSTKKQAIRNLKNEAKVIDVQRQKKLKIIEGKRREDIKLSNQFVEQTNIEYKTMVTSQPDKRFKLKRNRGDTRNNK